MESAKELQSLTIGGLSEAADVTARTIRYYVSEGLLAPPEKGGRGATYNDEHLARLLLIKRLKEEYLPLQEIVTLLRGLDRREVFGLLEQKKKSRTRTRSAAKQHLKELLRASSSPTEDSDQLRYRLEARRHPAGGDEAVHLALGDASVRAEANDLNPSLLDPLSYRRFGEIKPIGYGVDG